MAQMQNPVVKYVKDAKQSGMSNQQIMQALTDAGWKSHEILDLVLEHAQPQVSTDDIITVSNITKHYGKVKALDGVSLGVKRGQVTALLGPNGAGKTTLVRILTTLLTPSSGVARVAGCDVVRDA